MPTKEEIIKEVYNSEFGSAKETLADARKKDPTITLKDVQAWREKFIPRKAPLRGFNSYVAPGPKHQFQVDLFVYKFEQQAAPVLKKQRGKKYTANVHQYGLLAVDSFTKFTHVVPVDRKLQSSWRKALEEIFAKMGKPNQIYSDPDSSLLGKELKGFLDRQGIELVTTYEHANIAERTIRTIKSLLDKRIEARPRVWTEVLPEVLKKYNEKMVHSSIGMTPEEATNPGAEFDVKTKLEINRIKNRSYPELRVGDTVRVYKKKSKFAKERVPVWEDRKREIKAIQTSFGQKFYVVEDIPRPMIRSNLLKV